MVKVENYTVAVAGRVSGLWNKDSKSFEVKRGVTKNGKKYQIFEISVSSKDKDSGEWTNGKGIKVMLWGETKVDHNQEIGIKGKLQPDNYENKEGKTIYGNMINAFDGDIFTPDAYESKGESKPTKKEDVEEPWDA